MEGRNSQISRVLRITKILDGSRGLSAKEIRTHLESYGDKVSLRTIYRDIENIEWAGFPIIQEELDTDLGTVFKWRGRPPGLCKNKSETDLIEFFLWKQNLIHALKGSPILDASLKIISQQLKGFTSCELNYMAELDRVVEFGDSVVVQHLIDSDVLATFIACCLEEEAIRCSTAEGDITFIPKGIRVERGFLIGISKKPQEAKVELHVVKSAVMMIQAR